jgi:hypothetical protein
LGIQRETATPKEEKVTYIKVPPEERIPGTPAGPGVLVYRGFSSPVEYNAIIAGGIRPRRELRIDREWAALYVGPDTLAHVLEFKREHFVSFSFQRRAAACYATTRYTSPGWIATLRLPGVAGAQKVTSGNFSVWFGIDGTFWVDPRHASIPTASLGSGTEWFRMRARADVDDEFLLAGGAIRPAQVERIEPDDCDRSFLPWADSGE